MTYERAPTPRSDRCGDIKDVLKGFDLAWFDDHHHQYAQPHQLPPEPFQVVACRGGFPLMVLRFDAQGELVLRRVHRCDDLAALACLDEVIEAAHDLIGAPGRPSDSTVKRFETALAFYEAQPLADAQADIAGRRGLVGVVDQEDAQRPLGHGHGLATDAAPAMNWNAFWARLKARVRGQPTYTYIDRTHEGEVAGDYIRGAAVCTYPTGGRRITHLAGVEVHPAKPSKTSPAATTKTMVRA